MTGTVSAATYERAIAGYEDTALRLFALDSDSDEAKKALRDVEVLRRRMKVSWQSKPREGQLVAQTVTPSERPGRRRIN